MEISARTTTSALRKYVFPVLREAGFDDWASRKTWRHRKGVIDCVEFRSFNAYHAGVLDCTTASVSVWIGSWPSFFPTSEHPPKDGPKGPRPREAEMPIRGQLAPSVRHSSIVSDLIWAIKSEKEAEAAALEISEQFKTYGLSWLNKEWRADALLEFLIEEPDGYAELEAGPHGAYQCIDAGNTDSPLRNRMLGELAVASGNYKLAAEKYERARWALNQGSNERYLYLSETDDQKLLDLVASYEKLAGPK